MQSQIGLGSITTNKASGGDRIPVELFQILKDDDVKVCPRYASKFGKLNSGHRTGKGQFSFQSLRKAMPKNVQTTANYTYFTRLLFFCITKCMTKTPTKMKTRFEAVDHMYSSIYDQ